MTQKLNDIEIQAVQMFFEIFPHWKPILMSHISSATISREDKESSYFVDFFVQPHVIPLETKTNVPVEIIVGLTEITAKHGTTPSGYPIINASQKLKILNNNVLGIQLHFKGGYLSELEFYNLAGQQLNFDKLSYLPRVYITNKGQGEGDVVP